MNKLIWQLWLDLFGLFLTVGMAISLHYMYGFAFFWFLFCIDKDIDNMVEQAKQEREK